MNGSFYKSHGAGNDFILFDNRLGDFNLDQAAIVRLCDRRFGVGADGLMTLNQSSDSDFHLDYYNADGSLGSLCGNGSRCAVALAHQLQMIGEETQFSAADGIHTARLDPHKNLVALDMHDVKTIQDRKESIFLDTGSPHDIRLVDQLNDLDVEHLGRQLREDIYGPEGANINFIEQKSSNTFAIRTYERGVEAETLACGTGAVAAAIAMHYSQKTSATSLELDALGGTLHISFNPTAEGYTDVVLTGPAAFVFKGDLAS